MLLRYNRAPTKPNIAKISLKGVLNIDKDLTSCHTVFGDLSMAPTSWGQDCDGLSEGEIPRLQRPFRKEFLARSLKNIDFMIVELKKRCLN